MNELTIPKYLISEHTPLEVMMYANISIYAKYSLEDKIFMPRSKLLYDLYGPKEHNSYQVEQAAKGIEELEQLELLKYDPKFKGVNINCEKFYPGQYISIASKEYKMIRSIYEPGYFQWLLFHYYCHLIMSLNGNINIDGRSHIIGFMPQTFFSEAMDISPSTVRTYNKKLKDANLLFIKRRKFNTSIYCRYDDQKLLKKFISIS